MTRPAAILFDCAQTLLWAKFDPVRMAMVAAERLGLPADSRAAQSYGELLRARAGAYTEANLKGQDATDEWWHGITVAWAQHNEWPDSAVPHIIQQARDYLYSPESEVFGVYDDTIPALEALRERGVRMGVISNWDASLDRTLQAFGLAGYFEMTVASMVVGSEKPDAEIFRIGLERMELEASDAWYIGDNPIADGQGGRQAGMHVLLVDRDNESDSPYTITSLHQVVEQYDACASRT